MPQSRSKPPPAQNVRKCPVIPGPTNPLSLSPVENPEEQKDLCTLNSRSFLLALPALRGLILPAVPKPRLALTCLVCPTMAELPFSQGTGDIQRCWHIALVCLNATGTFTRISCSHALTFWQYIHSTRASQVALVVKSLPVNAGEVKRPGFDPTLGSGRSPRGGHGNPLHYSCLENSYGQRSLMGHKESDMTEAIDTFYTAALIEELAFSFPKNWFLYYLIAVITSNCSYNLSIYISH